MTSAIKTPLISAWILMVTVIYYYFKTKEIISFYF